MIYQEKIEKLQREKKIKGNYRKKKQGQEIFFVQNINSVRACTTMEYDDLFYSGSVTCMPGFGNKAMQTILAMVCGKR